MTQKSNRPRYSRTRISFLFAGLLFFVFLLPAPHTSAQDIAKQDVLAKYETVVNLAQELNVYEEDVLHVVPKIRMAGQSLLKNDFEKADSVLTEALSDLELMKSQRPTQLQRAFQLEWLEVYREVIQKYAVIALIGYILVSLPYFRRMLKAGSLSMTGKMYFTFLIMGCAILFSFFDVLRYGESAWAFLDIQVVLITIGGLLGGWLAGLLAGIGIGILRLMLNTHFVLYFGIVVAAGLLSGGLSYFLRDYRRTGRVSFFSGALVGMMHGMATYLPMGKYLPPIYALLSVLFLVLLEGTATFIFFAVISGILREEDRREMEKELLKTKLQFLQAQINPHFLYNALNTISAICARERAATAHNLVLKLADFMRRTVKRVDDKVTLREEMDSIDSYLEIEKARFQERLQIEKQFNIRQELWDTRIPFLILQPIVENAIKHGISKKETGGTLKVKIGESDNRLRVEISDNGEGMSEMALGEILKGNGNGNGNGLGIGIQNINQRLIRYLGPEYALQFESQVGKGTKVVVNIPLNGAEKEKVKKGAGES